MDLQRIALTPAHIPRLVELEAELFPEDSPWREQDFAAEIAQPHTVYVGVTAGELLVGYGGLAIMGPKDAPECEVHTIGVDPAFQRRGVARMIMDNFIHVANTLGAPIFLEVRTDNEPAKALYHAYNFAEVGVRKRYYQPSGADALVMLRQPEPKQKGPTP